MSDKRTKSIIEGLIVRDGLSYVDAIKRCEREASAAAQPYLEAAATIRAWLAELQSASGESDA